LLARIFFPKKDNLSDERFSLALNFSFQSMMVDRVLWSREADIMTTRKQRERGREREMSFLFYSIKTSSILEGTSHI
jgi:hypothetical protein